MAGREFVDVKGGGMFLRDDFRGFKPRLSFVYT